MIRTATRDDLPLLVDILRRANDAPYDIAAVAEEKCFGSGVAGEPRVRLFEDAGLAVTCGKYLRLIAVAPEHRRRGIGTALLRDSAASIVGAEAGNYFTPGVVESDEATIAFLRARGFRESLATWNLHAAVNGDLRDSGAIRTGVDGDLVDFIRREFGPIWAFEVQRAAAAFVLPGIGFAAVEANNRGLGTFGPAGVVSSARGQGHGRTLVAAAHAEIARMGYERMVIPWTDAIHFYRRSCGAEPAHRFVTFTRP